MNGQKFLIYLDILGFEILSDAIAKASKIDARKVRHDFVDAINQQIESLAGRGEIVGNRFGGGDDWLLVTEDLNSLFLVISKLLDHNTGYQECQKIPLEIAVGTADLDKWARLQGRDLVTEDSTISFLKTRIIEYYHKWYKTNHGTSITSTYLVFTQSAYSQLAALDKAACRRIEADDTVKRPTFFAVEYEKIVRRLKNAEFLSIVDLPGRRES